MIRKHLLSLCSILLVLASIAGLCYVLANKNVNQSAQSQITYDVPSGIRWNAGMNCFQIFSYKGISYIGSNFNVSSNGDILQDAETTSNIASADSTYYIMQDIYYDSAVTIEHSAVNIIFTGILEGRGLNFYNFPVIENNSEYSALFYKNQGTIRNLNMVNPYFLSTLSGIKTGIFSFENSGEIDNCNMSFTASETTPLNLSGIVSEFGGFVHTNKGIIKNSSISGYISIIGSAGGFSYISSGSNTADAVFLNSVNNLNISGASVAGGITAVESASTSMTDCKNQASISADTTSGIAGGLAGIVESGLTIKKSLNSGEITGYISGGIIGNAICIGIYNLTDTDNTAKVYGVLRSAGIINTSESDFTNLSAINCSNSGNIMVESGYDKYQISYSNSGSLTDCVGVSDIDNLKGLYFTLINDTAYSVSGKSSTAIELLIPSVYNNIAITTISENAFTNNVTLLSIKITNSITAIGDNAFTGCTNLKSIYVDSAYVAGLENSELTNLFANASTIYVKTRLTIGTAITDNFVKTGTQNGYDIYKHITENLSFNAINNSAYSVGIGSATETEIIIPSMYLNLPVTEIDVNGFKDNTAITNVIIPDSVNIIGSFAFYGCTNLKLIDISDSVKIIGGSAFENCSNITNIDLSDKISVINDNTFADCSSLKEIILPYSVISIGNSAFLNCTNLMSIEISDNLTNLGNAAFSGCTKLKSVFIDNDYVSNLTYEETTNLYENASIIYVKNGLTAGTAITDKFIINETINGYDKYINATKNLAYTAIDTTAYSVGYGSATDTEVLIPSTHLGLPVTEIIVNGFKDKTAIASVLIPDSITTIGNEAFVNCTSLTSIIIPDSVTTFGIYIFDKCSNLSSITLGSGITSIAFGAFQNCTKLTNIIIPENVTTIEDYAFVNCSSLTSIIIPDSVTTFGVSIFANCSNLSSITIPDSITSIPTGVFRDCTKLTNIIIPENVTTIGGYSFRNCSSLTSIIIPENVTTIGGYSFRNCSSLTSIIIPESVTNIYDCAFILCTKLATVYVDSSFAAGLVYDEITSLYANATTVYIKTGLAVGTAITDKFIINETADGYNKYIISTENLAYTAIDTTAYSVGYGSATDTEVLITSTHLGLPVTEIIVEGFKDKTAITSVLIPDSIITIGTKAFYGCTGLTSITIPDSVTIFGVSIFANCSNLSSITLGSGITSISSCTFSDCTSLTSVIIPDSVTNFEYGVFMRCSSLSNVILGNGIINIKNNVFFCCHDLTSIIIPDSVTNIGNMAFYQCGSLTSIILGSGVESIGVNAFYSCNNLTSIRIPDSVTSIADGAFSFSGIITVYVDSPYLAGLENAASIALYNKAETVYFKTGLTVGAYILDDFTKTETVGGYDKYLKTTNNLEYTAIDTTAYSVGYGASTATEVVIPLTHLGLPITAITAEGFKDKTAITSILMPDIITTIGTQAFSGCTELKSVKIGSGITNIGENAFDSCINLATVYIDSSYASSFANDETTCLYTNATTVYVKTGLAVGTAITDNFTKTGTNDSYDIYTKNA